MFTNAEILQIALRQSAVDLSAAAEDFKKTKTQWCSRCRTKRHADPVTLFLYGSGDIDLGTGLIEREIIHRLADKFIILYNDLIGEVHRFAGISLEGDMFGIQRYF